MEAPKRGVSSGDASSMKSSLLADMRELYRVIRAFPQRRLLVAFSKYYSGIFWKENHIRCPRFGEP